MHKLSCIVTDDEPFARKGLEGYIARIDFLTLSGTCENALELNALLQQQQPDLLFLDIEMPYLSGIDFLKQVSNPPMVIITTAYKDYAVDGFNLDVTDYLLKPIPFDRFLKACNKAWERFTAKQQDTVITPADNSLFVKADGKLQKINIDDVLFMEAMENYTAVYLPGKKLITQLPLKAFTEKLPAQQFAQPHKSYLVAINKIDAIEGNLLHIQQYQVPISKYEKEQLLERILQNKWLRKT
ncbi:LytR/AlgR family response regulator transcription factor [Deminuibacter soli]|uniref:DNA-binding response regulator n=1 Tax=Deminuibacter soli TaxID=2291815 RepID=A0A3E1NJZ6_9BACT|nr:LytTR family DNA-binding domain-containing protein [Deminuibacter soli]RFM28257.1 DNA-binding response regulator [Deminuibacter soli]